MWCFLCGSGSRFQFRVRDFRPRTQTVFCGQEFCGFKLTFRFCDYLDVNLQDFVWKFFAEERFLIPENGTCRPRPREALGRTPELGRLPILRTSVDLPETADFREQYFCGAAIQYASKQLLLLLLLPNFPPPIISYLSFLSRT